MRWVAIAMIAIIVSGCKTREPLEICPHGVQSQEIISWTTIGGMPSQVTQSFIRCADKRKPFFKGGKT